MPLFFSQLAAAIFAHLEKKIPVAEQWLLKSQAARLACGLMREYKWILKRDANVEGAL
jgi:hypothetical protein